MDGAELKQNTLCKWEQVEKERVSRKISERERERAIREAAQNAY